MPLRLLPLPLTTQRVNLNRRSVDDEYMTDVKKVVFILGLSLFVADTNTAYIFLTHEFNYV